MPASGCSIERESMMMTKLPAWWRAAVAAFVVVAAGLAVAGGLGVSSGLDVPDAESTREDLDRTGSAEVALRVEGMT